MDSEIRFLCGSSDSCIENIPLITPKTSYPIPRNQNIHFQIISVISSINGSVSRIISMVSQITLIIKK